MLARAMDELPTEINVITLNCWGLKYVSKLRNERLAEIGRQLAAMEPTPHIVALQECWCQEDYKQIRRDTRAVLPYGKFYHGGVVGGGLAILSRWPLEESSMHQYPLNGRPTAFWRGDWYSGKGIAHAKIRYGPGLKHIVEVFNTHVRIRPERSPSTPKGAVGLQSLQTHAAYGERNEKLYLLHRTAQAWELSKHLRGACERGHLVVAAGDLNTVPLSLPYRLITSNAPVRDTWRVLHPDSALGPADNPLERARRRPIPTAGFSLQENGATSDSVLNSWRGPPEEPARDAIDPKAKRIDYVFASTGDPAVLGGYGWTVKSSHVVFTARHPALDVSLSDHFGVQTTLALHPVAPPPAPPRPTAAASTPDGDGSVSRGTYLQSPASSSPRGSRDDNDFARQQLSGRPVAGEDGGFATAATYDEVLAMVHAHLARARAQRRWRGAHFFLGLAAAVACHVGVWFSPANFVAFLLMLVASFGLVAGTVDGLIALLFTGREIRALKEFEWEMMNAKAMASGAPPLVEEGGEKGW
jgi:sphingomyelin phosphodiesterase 2